MNKLTTKANLIVLMMNEKISKLGKDNKGATMVEYGLLLVVILILAYLAFKNLGTAVSGAATSATAKFS